MMSTTDDPTEGVQVAVESDDMENKYDFEPHETSDSPNTIDLRETIPDIVHRTFQPDMNMNKPQTLHHPRTTLSGGYIFGKHKPLTRKEILETNSPFSRRQLSDLDMSTEETEEETTPLPHDQVGISGAVFNLLNYTMGAGVLALPYAFSQAGLGIGIFIVVIVYTANLLTDWFLLGSTRASLGFSYEQLAHASFGPRFATGVKVFIIFDSFGTLSAYMLVIGDTLHKFFAHYYSHTIWIDSRFFMFIVLIVFLIPFCFVQNINSFAISSVLSIIPLIYLIVYQFVYYGQNGVSEGESIHGSEAGIGFFHALPVVIFAFASQQVFYPLWNEVRERGGGESHMARIINYAGISSIIAYLLSGLGGYLSFPQSAKAMILDSFPISIELNILLFITAISIVLSYPVVVFPCRYNIDRLIWQQKELTYVRFVGQNIAIVLIAFGIAVAIPSFAAILGFFGSITATSIAYILPSLFYLRLNREPFVTNRMKWVALALLIIATMGGITSFVMIARDFRPTYRTEEK